MASELGVQTIQHTNGTDAMTIDSSGAVTFPNSNINPVAVIVDEKSASTHGGTFTSGAWRHRDLNTEVFDPDGIVTIASNQFTLGAGTYIIEFEAPAYNCNRHKARLYDVTGSAVIEYGATAYSNTGGPDQTISKGYARVVITANNTYKIEHRCTNSSSTYGFGVGSEYGVPERYTMVKIQKVA